jgi:nucleotide-binding universal stress UspA family protein
MFRNILLPTDASATAKTAAEIVANQIPAGSDTKVTIILVIQPLNPDETDFDLDVVERHNHKMQEKAHEALSLTARIFENRGIAHTTKIVEGDPVSTAIAHEAESGDYDLIAMGSRGLGMAKNNLHYLGSVTEHVIRRVSIPVLVIPTAKA